MKMPNMCPFEKKEKEVFQKQKNFVQETTFVQFFMYWETKKNLERKDFVYWAGMIISGTGYAIFLNNLLSNLPKPDVR